MVEPQKEQATIKRNFITERLVCSCGPRAAQDFMSPHESRIKRDSREIDIELFSIREHLQSRDEGWQRAIIKKPRQLPFSHYYHA